MAGGDDGVAQVVAGIALAFGLLATTGVLEELLSTGPTAQRITTALPALVLVAAGFAVRGMMDAGVAQAQARVVPAVRRQAEEQLVDAGLRVELAAMLRAARHRHTPGPWDGRWRDWPSASRSSCSACCCTRAGSRWRSLVPR